MNEINQNVVLDQQNNMQTTKKKFNTILWSIVVVIISIVISIVLKTMATSMANGGEEAIPLAPSTNN